MIIHDVFPMSILNSLQSILKKGEKEEKNVSGKNSSKKAKTNIEVKSPDNKINNGIVSGIKSSEPIFDIKKDSGIKDVHFKKDVNPSNKIENSKKESDGTTFDDLLENATEKAQKIEDKVEKEEESIEISKEDQVVDDKNQLEDIAEVMEKEESPNSENNSEKDMKDKNYENIEEKRDNMTLLTDKELLTSESLDKDFTAAFIDAGLDTVKHCFQCGTCGGGCPSGRRTPYKVRQLVRKCLLGLKEEVISDPALWMCTTCYTCQERCPRSVIIVEIVKKARNIAAHAGYMAKAHKLTGSFVIKTGHAVPINPETKTLRARVGLTELPPTTHSHPEALEEVQKICAVTGFDELIGFDPATGELKD